MAKPTKDHHARKQVAGQVEVKKNPFEERSNRKEKHPALNRKIMGANRNVGQARAKAQERREATLLPEFRQRKASSQIEDRRFGESSQTLTREEKMLKRFQALRSNRASKYSLGDGEDEGKSGGAMTHMGQSLSDLLDDGDNVEYEDAGEDGEDVDVDDLVQRMRNGETFSGPAGGRRLTKREAMMDVIRKSKMLKMERQKDKDEDEDERDRLDSMTSNLVQNLAFRPTKAAAFAASAAAASTGTSTGASDTYDKMVRELTLDPRVVATDRTKTAEEVAKEERDRLEALEERRIKRMADESDGGGSDDDEGDDDGKNDEPNARKRRKRAQIDQSLEKEVSTNSDVPFLIECPRSHLELLEFLESYPQADLDQVLVRIRTTNSIHVGNTNRQKLIKLCQVLLDHLQLVGERACQVTDAQQAKRELAVICKHLFALISLSEKEIASMFFVKLERAHRLFDLQLRSVRPGSEDLGRERLEFNARPQKMPGGHKDGLSQQLNAGLEHLAKMRRDHELASSPTRVWPTGGEFALFGAVSALFSTTDFRHPIATPCALFLGQVLVESPVRGCGDVMCALQTAQLVEKLTRMDGAGGGRFSPEVFCFLRVVLGQLGQQQKKSSQGLGPNARCLRLLDQYPGHYHGAFDFIRKPKGTACSLREAAQSGGAFLHGVVELMENVLSFSLPPDLPCGDVFLRPLVALMQATQLELFAEIVVKANERIAQVDAGRQKLRMQEFAPVVKASSMDPKLGNNVRPGEVERTLKRKVKEERKGVSRELRLDGQFLANAAQREKREKLDSVRSARQRNFADLQIQQAGFNQMVKSGFAVKGAGVGGLNLKGRRMGKKQAEE